MPDPRFVAAGVATALIVGLLVAYGLVAVASAVGSGGARTPASIGYVTVSATGGVNGYPTQAKVYLMVNGSGPTTQLATQNISLTLGQLNSTLYPFVGGNMSKVSTESYNIYKAYNKSAYVATEQVGVTVPEIGNVSMLLGALSRIPNVYVESTSAQLSDPQIAALRSQALAIAMQNATAQATAVLSGKGVSVDNVTISSYSVYPYYYGGVFGGASIAPPAAASSPVFFSGTSRVSESVTVLFTYQK